MSEDTQRYITREEFEHLDRNTAKGFRDLSAALAEIRNDLKEISNRGPDIKAIISGIGVFGTFVFAIGGSIVWGWNEKAQALEATALKHDEALDERGEWIGRASYNLSQLSTDVGRLVEEVDGRGKWMGGTEATIQRLEADVRDIENRAEGIALTRWSSADHDIYAREVDSRFRHQETEINRRFEQFDVALQREMRLLDEKVQNEMRLLDEHQAELTSERLRSLESHEGRIRSLESNGSR